MQNASIYQPLAIILIVVMLFLLLVIGILANVLMGSIDWYRQKEKEEENNKDGGAGKAAVITSLVLLFSTLSVHAQEAAEETVAAVQQIGGLTPTAFYTMIGVIGVELLVIMVMLLQLRSLIRKNVERKPSVFQATKLKALWEKLNKFKPVEQESELDTGHDYDGIRELNNRLPPWWLYGFYFSIIFAVVYLWRYHVAESAPLSAQELEIAMKQAEIEKEAYLKRSANNVDENTVVLLTDASALAGGKKVYEQSCSPCHGMSGEGSVGPNLTDDHWLHGGSLSDIFKSIKYGWPEKGMRSWKEDLSPVQIAQIASYLKSLRGTNPPNAKEPQGELYVEEDGAAAPADAASDAPATNN